MNYATIKKYDIANGPGVRVSLFVSGCRHHCPGCFNAETWNFCFGTPYTAETEQEILDAALPDYIEGLSVLGGEPFEPENQPFVLALIEKFRKKYPQKTIWCYSGYTYEELQEGILRTNHDIRTMTEKQKNTAKRILENIDVLVDGEFILDKKDLKLRFRGSSNQRLLDIPATHKNKTPVLWK